MTTPLAIAFTKMHGCANDYLLIDAITSPERLTMDTSIVRAMSNRRTGIGADGIIILSMIDEQWHARVINADGSEGGMCGNGLRCAARFLHERHDAPQDMVIIMGGRTIRAQVRDNGQVALDMGTVELDIASMPVDAAHLGTPYCGFYSLDGFRAGFADIGNPHMAILLDAPPTEALLAQLGPRFEHHGAFPQGMNVHLVYVRDRQELAMLSHERGVGPTQACGSGACAAVVLLASLDLIDHDVTVQVLGGSLNVCATQDGSVTLIGPTAYVCDGVFVLGMSS